MPKATTFCSDILNLVLNATNIANIADNTATGPVTMLYISLHSSNPGVGGSQLTGEVGYSSYSRVSIQRSSTSPTWSVSSGSATNISACNFPQCGISGSAASYVAIGISGSGAGKVLWEGALNSPVTIQSPYIPQFLASTLTVSET